MTNADPCSSGRRPSQEMVDNAALFLERRRSVEPTIGAIQPDLYRRRGSVITQKRRKGQSIGRIQLKVDYDFAKSDFIVSILDGRLPITRLFYGPSVSAKDIPPKIDEFYMKVHLSPEEKTIRRLDSLKQKQKNRPGEFERMDYRFPVSYDELLDKKLVVQLHDCGGLPGKKEVIVGDVVIEMNSLDPSVDLVIWADIETKSPDDTYGELLLALTYLPSVERLTVTVLQARDLCKVDDHRGTADPYVKVTLIKDGKTTKKRKTTVRKNTMSPTWNEALNFGVSEQALRKTDLEVHILDHDLIGNDLTMGQVVIGTHSTDSKTQRMWEDLLSASKSSSLTWLKLRHFPLDSKRRESH